MLFLILSHPVIPSLCILILNGLGAWQTSGMFQLDISCFNFSPSISFAVWCFPPTEEAQEEGRWSSISALLVPAPAGWCAPRFCNVVEESKRQEKDAGKNYLQAEGFSCPLNKFHWGYPTSSGICADTSAPVLGRKQNSKCRYHPFIQDTTCSEADF